MSHTAFSQKQYDNNQFAASADARCILAKPCLHTEKADLVIHSLKCANRTQVGPSHGREYPNGLFTFFGEVFQAHGFIQLPYSMLFFMHITYCVRTAYSRAYKLIKSNLVHASVHTRSLHTSGLNLLAHKPCSTQSRA